MLGFGLLKYHHWIRYSKCEPSKVCKDSKMSLFWHGCKPISPASRLTFTTAQLWLSILLWHDVQLDWLKLWTIYRHSSNSFTQKNDSWILDGDWTHNLLITVRRTNHWASSGSELRGRFDIIMDFRCVSYARYEI